MNVSYSVMAHQSRIDMALDLAASLGACRMAIDSDTLHLGETLNGARAWTMHDPDAAWHVVLQDDAQPIPGFRDHVIDALAASTGGVVSLYVGTGRPHSLAVGIAVQKAERVGAAWLTHPNLLWGVAVAIPTRLIPELTSWIGVHARPTSQYDRVIGQWAAADMVPVEYTLPCLVDHADTPSLLPKAGPMPFRKAWRLGVPATYDTVRVAIS